MTKKVGRVVLIAPEPEQECEQCGKQAETRPYGPGGARVCFACAMKDEAGTKARMKQALFGEDES